MLSSIVGALLVCVSSISTNDLKLSFNGKGYAKYGQSLPDLHEFTLCYWIKIHKRVENPTYVFSYATTKEPDMLVTWHQILNDSSIIYGMNIGGNAVQMEVSVQNTDYNIDPLESWQHICYIWSSHTMKGYVVINGCLDYETITTVKSYNPETAVVRGGGLVVLGQDQDVYNGGFDSKEAFSGDLFDLHLWNEELHRTKLKSIQKCGAKEGNLLAWLPNPLDLRGVSIQETEVCDLAKINFEKKCLYGPF